MSTQELQSYRLSSLEDPTDEMLHAIMEKVAEPALCLWTHQPELFACPELVEGEDGIRLAYKDFWENPMRAER